MSSRSGEAADLSALQDWAGRWGLFLPDQIILKIFSSSLGRPQTKIQRSAARFVTQNYRQTASVASLIQNLGWFLENKKKTF